MRDERGQTGTDLKAPPRLSVIVPALNEAGAIGHLLADLGRLPITCEVIVVDGGSGDGTVAIAEKMGATVLRSPAGRGTQLRAGAAAARGDLFLFLHADVRLDEAAIQSIAEAAASSSGSAHALKLRIATPGVVYRLIEAGVNLRSSVLGLPYGDQGLLIDKAAYEAVDGFRPIPVMEDVALVRALRRSGVRIGILDADVAVSPRRWHRDGPVRRSARNVGLLVRFLMGWSPESIAARYPPEHAE